MRSLLSIEDMTVKYGESTALRNVSLEVTEGGITGIIGPNGAGKTTLLDAVSGLVPYNGTIRYDGESIDDVNASERVNRGIIHCTEERDLFPHFSVRQNLLMGAHLRDSGIEESIDEVYEMFPRLKERSNQDAGTLSGGEQQMLAIGRALMSDPELLMLDEPTLGLAPVIIDRLDDTIEALTEQDQTVLLVEQNSVFAMRHSDHLALLENGQFSKFGTTQELSEDDYIKEAYLGIS